MTRSMLAVGLLLGLLLSVGCDGGSTLGVDLQTDLDPGFDFDLIEVSVEGHGAPVQRLVSVSDGFLDPVRISDHAVPNETQIVRVALFALAGSVLVAERSVSVAVTSDTSVTVLITRSCLDVSCGEGTQCSAGSCVDESCAPEQPARCGSPECAATADCPTGAACAVPLCVAGVCLLGAGECAGGGLCDPMLGCSGDDPDGGPPDAGFDSGFDAGSDAGFDAGPPAPFCGDTTCNGTEDCSSCSDDCGVCPFCGDARCSASEATCRSCASDCRHGDRGPANTGDPCSADELGLYRCAMMNDGPCAGMLASQVCSMPASSREWTIVSCTPTSCDACFCETSSGCS